MTKPIKYDILIIENKRKEVNKMIKMVFDMDGTIADLYGVENWLPQLRAEDPTPYAIARPLVNMHELANLLNELKAQGEFSVSVVTWGSMDCSVEYTREVKKVKRQWLENYNFPFDEMHCIKYGTPKTNFINLNDECTILWDDNEEIRKAWNKSKKKCVAFDPSGNNIIEFLKLMIEVRKVASAE